MESNETKSYRQMFKALCAALSGRKLKGMKTRYVLAIVLAILSILVDAYFLYTNYNYLPSQIGTIYDGTDIALVKEDKAVLWDYELQRIVILIVSVVVGLLVRAVNRASIVRRRISLLLVETASLIIMTGVGISMVLLALSLGDNSQKLSNFFEVAVGLLWLAILLVEFRSDLKFLKRNSDSKAD